MEASCGHPPRGIRSPQAIGARAVKARVLDNLADLGEATGLALIDLGGR